MYSNIRIVLVGTSHPGNIGASARAMKNMCLDQLYLVSPGDFPCAEATARASGADDVLAKATVCGSLGEALKGCRLVVGASARLRSLDWPQLEPRECAARLVETAQQASVAVVFGREQSGLSNQELEQCQYLVHIPTNSEYSSLNLAAAVQVLAYEIHQAGRLITDSQAHKKGAQEAEGDLPASADDVALFHQHLEQTLQDIDFLNPKQPKLLMRRLKRLFYRASPDQTEINILRGFLSAIDRVASACRDRK
ncbi:MAG: tRNA (cytosine(32)/uridine(32)-2'-O)-methyltransferase TrmJ [Gammaproteobacteria bacterium]|nr:tRNA (cytosine(32)/uridine(32)-2'-O)-methyltransferase TrmJ [Gammaproteobacteria bacterium]MCK5091246.1 tRNA (cytosine(32)/uridine(32)-2'-O)-methyltransferase TrmJ [Gammaproteobacteria bacterium]